MSNKRIVCDFIEEGTKEEHTFDAVEGVHGALAITFRPAYAEEIGKLIDANGPNGTDELYMQRAIDALPKLLSGWTLKTKAGVIVPINRENVARVNRKLLMKIIDMVFFQTEAPAAVAVAAS